MPTRAMDRWRRNCARAAWASRRSATYFDWPYPPRDGTALKGIDSRSSPAKRGTAEMVDTMRNAGGGLLLRARMAISSSTTVTCRWRTAGCCHVRSCCRWRTACCHCHLPSRAFRSYCRLRTAACCHLPTRVFRSCCRWRTAACCHLPSRVFGSCCR